MNRRDFLKEATQCVAATCASIGVAAQCTESNGVSSAVKELAAEDYCIGVKDETWLGWHFDDRPEGYRLYDTTWRREDIERHYRQKFKPQPVRSLSEEERLAEIAFLEQFCTG